MQTATATPHTHDRPEIVTDEMLEYLDDLRESGETNMFGAGPYVQREFGLQQVGRSLRTRLFIGVGDMAKQAECRHDPEGGRQESMLVHGCLSDHPIAAEPLPQPRYCGVWVTQTRNYAVSSLMIPTQWTNSSRHRTGAAP